MPLHGANSFITTLEGTTWTSLPDLNCGAHMQKQANPTDGSPLPDGLCMAQYTRGTDQCSNERTKAHSAPVKKERAMK